MLNNIFSDRELSVIIWLGVVAIFVLYSSTKSKEIRQSFFNLIKAFFQRKLIGYQVLMLGYIAGQIYLLYQVGFWHEGMLGSTLIWLIAPYIALFKDVTGDWRNPDFLKEKIKKLVTHTAILEYIIGLKSFPFIVELIITPMFALVALAYAYTDGKQEYKPFDKVTEWLVILYVITALGYSSWFLVTTWSFEYLWGFTFVFIMSALFIPFIYLLRLHVIYQSVFVRMTVLHKNTNFPKRYARLKGAIAFRADTVNLQRWCDHMTRHEINSRKDIDESISIIKESIKKEQCPVKVNIEHGWSPYIIKDCLAEYDLPAGTYNKYWDDEWGASSPYHEFEGELLNNNMAFYVYGTENIATKLKLSFNGNDPANQKEHLPEFKERAKHLCKMALYEKLPPAIEIAILNKSNVQSLINGKEVMVIFDDWPKSSIENGFGLEFIIQNPETKISQ